MEICAEDMVKTPVKMVDMVAMQEIAQVVDGIQMLVLAHPTILSILVIAKLVTLVAQVSLVADVKHIIVMLQNVDVIHGQKVVG